jgi:hypothetical protein
MVHLVFNCAQTFERDQTEPDGPHVFQHDTSSSNPYRGGIPASRRSIPPPSPRTRVFAGFGVSVATAGPCNVVQHVASTSWRDDIGADPRA